MRGVTLITILAVLIQHAVIAQAEYVSGHVKDESGNPIQFAHVRIGGTYSGTLTNVNGRFQLNIEDIQTTQLVISCVGYVSKTISVTNAKEVIVELKEDLVRLNEVVIVPKDYARELVASAIEKIPQNYPSRNELITGFIRETLSKDSLADSLHYISEAQTLASKASYEETTKLGEVKLIKGRKLDINTEGLPIRIYAGAHLPHRFDMVIQREGPLNLKKMNNYIYEVDDTIQFDNRALYSVGYLSRNGHESGTISILERSLAIVSIEQFQNKDKFKGINIIKANSRQYLKSVTSYDIHEDSLWRLNYVRYSTKFKNGKRNIYLNSVYTTHGFEVENEKIPYQERIQFGDFLIEQVDEFDPTYWSEYNVTLADQKFEEIYEKNPKKNLVKDKKEQSDRSILDRIEFTYSIRAVRTLSNNHFVSFNKGEIAIGETVLDDEEIKWGITFGMMYEVSERSLVFFENGSLFDGSRSRDLTIGYSYRQPVSKVKRAFLAGSIGYGYQEFNKSIGEITLENNTSISGKKIDADKVEVYSSTNSHFLIASMSFIYEKSKRLKFQAAFDHFNTFHRTNGLRFREDQNIFRAKTVFLKNGKEGLDIDGSNSSNFKQDWSLRFGVIFSF